MSTSTPRGSAPLYDLFGGTAGFADAARAAETISRRELARVSDLVSRCEEAQKRAAQAIAVQSAQAQARQAAGRLVTDTESYLVDVRVADALISGLRQPHVKIVSVACIVRGNLVTGETCRMTTGPAPRNCCARGQRWRPTSRPRERAAVSGTR